MAVVRASGGSRIQSRLRRIVAGASLGFLIAAPSLAQWIPGKTLHVPQARDTPFCEFTPVVRGATLVRIYNTTGGDCPAPLVDVMNTARLAADFGAERIDVSPGRRWMADRIWFTRLGETRDFDGIKATLIGSMETFYHREGTRSAFTPMDVLRQTRFLYERGKPVFILRSPGGRPYVMQSWSTYIDKDLSADRLAGLGVQLALPPGWRFERKMLVRDLVIDTSRTSGTIPTLRDELYGMYDACTDIACNYVP
jgi:hypothetical protein